MIPRIQQEEIKSKLSAPVLFIGGPRNVGKTRLIRNVLDDSNQAYTIWNGDNRKEKKYGIEEASKVETPYLIIRNAQFMSQLEAILDQSLGGKIRVRVIVCYSYKPLINEALLVALKNEGLLLEVFAPSFFEAANHFGLPHEEQLLEERLIYGNYPDVLDDLEHAEVTLRELVQDVIKTNLGAKDRVNKGDKLLRVMQLLAFQIGEPVSYNEIAEKSGLDNETVERYIQLLEEAHILINLPTFENGNRYELKKTHCVYFADNGIRNVLISNFNPSFLRNDMPQLWKNWLVSERVKWAKINHLQKEFSFWRTHTRQQMDLIEKGEDIRAFKMDWEKRNKVKVPTSFKQYYPEIKSRLLNRSSYWSFLTNKR